MLPISSPENTRRISRVALRDRLEGFPLLHLDFYKEDSSAPNWATWIKTQRLKRTEPNRGIRFQRIKPALEAVRANAGLTICGLAVLGPYIDDGTRPAVPGRDRVMDTARLSISLPSRRAASAPSEALSRMADGSGRSHSRMAVAACSISQTAAQATAKTGQARWTHQRSAPFHEAPFFL